MLLTPRGMLLVMKTLEDEWYDDIEANLFTHFCTVIYMSCVSALSLHIETL